MVAALTRKIRTLIALKLKLIEISTESLRRPTR